MALLSPVALGALKLSNRVVMAPLTRGRAGASRVANGYMAEYYAQRASAGMIITEATAICEQGYGWYGTPGIYSKEQAQGWKLITDAVHKNKGVIVAQLWHMGRRALSSFNSLGEIVAPSAIRVPGDIRVRDINQKEVPYEVPRALETHEVADIVLDFQRAARLAKDAGFDGVEIHAANGYLLDTFLQSNTNHRTDKYGGDSTQRVRVLHEVVEAVGDVFPFDRMGVRMSPNGVGGGMGSADNKIAFPFYAKQLAHYGLAYLHVMDGLGYGFHNLCAPVTLFDMKSAFGGPIIANVGFTQETAEGVIRSGAADAVAFGRPFITNPDLVERFKNAWPLHPPAPQSHWYGRSAEPGETLEGYLTYKPFSAPL